MAKKTHKVRADGRVELSMVIDGKRRSFLGHTEKEAKQKMVAAIKASAEKKEQADLFEKVAEKWWVEYSRKVKPGTWRAYEANYTRMLDRFRGYHMDEITPAMVQLWLEWFADRGYAQRSAKNAKSLLGLVYRYWCLESGKTYSPVSVASLPRGMAKSERQPPTPEQLAAVQAHPEGFGLAAWLFWFTGCRLGEALALQWRDVDLDAGVIHVTKAVNWFYGSGTEVGAPKTKNAVREVPILDPLRPLLEERRGPADAYVLGGGALPMTKSQYNRAWRDYCRKIGVCAERQRPTRIRKGGTAETRVEYAPLITAHQFRHEYASLLYRAGVGELETMRLMGHADIGMTHKIYTHLRGQQLGSAAARVNDYLAAGK